MWKCSKCASCCKIAGLIIREWDRGDGACKMLKDNLCTIYDTRPDICRVKDIANETQCEDACEKVRRMLWTLSLLDY